MSELVIRIKREDETRPVVSIESDGVSLGFISKLRLDLDCQKLAPQLEVELLRGFLLKSDLPNPVRADLKAVVAELEKHNTIIKAPK